MKMRIMNIPEASLGVSRDEGKLNGKTWDKPYIMDEVLESNCLLVFTMGLKLNIS